jgi:hypothetical protein
MSSMFRRGTFTRNRALPPLNPDGNDPSPPGSESGSQTGDTNGAGSSGARGGSADISASEYARKCKELMELQRSLRQLGYVSVLFLRVRYLPRFFRADSLIDLPRIAVIGGQSGE